MSEVLKAIQSYEPLISDSRLDRIVDTLHEEYPESEDFTFFTYFQPSTAHKLDDGFEVTLKDRAAFAILVPNPRHPQFQQLFFGFSPLDEWKARDNSTREKDAHDDPAYQAFRLGPLPVALDWYANTKALI